MLTLVTTNVSCQPVLIVTSDKSAFLFQTRLNFSYMHSTFSKFLLETFKNEVELLKYMNID